MKKALLYNTFVLVIFICSPVRGEYLLLDKTFPASSNQVPWSFSFTAPTDGRFLIRMDNPDASADGIITFRNVTRGFKYNDELFYGTTGDPLYDISVPSRIKITQGRDISWYALPVQSSWGSCTYQVTYSCTGIGTQNTGSNRIQVWYQAQPLTKPAQPPLLSLVSQPTQQNSVSATFNAGTTEGTLILDLVRTGTNGNSHCLYLDGRGVERNNVGGAADGRLMGIYLAMAVSPGTHTVMLRHEDDYWGDNQGVRQTDLYFISQPLSPPQDGSIVAWGRNDDGQCNVPLPNTGFVAVAAGGFHNIGLKPDGAIVVWGSNLYGQCNVPVPNTGFVVVAGGQIHSLGLKANGSIVGWGSNTYGQCNVPMPNTGFVAIAAAHYRHSLGLRQDGSIVAWGYNYYGQCNIPSPNTGFVKIAAGGYHSLGLKANGSIVAWGRNDDGQCNVPLPNTGFVAVAAGDFHSLGLKANGSIVAWGRNTYGQCNVPLPNTGFVAVAAGFNHSLGLKADGSIVGWGSNTYGQCNVPVPNTGFVAIAAGGYHSLGLKQSGGIPIVTICPIQNYVAATKTLSISASAVDSLSGTVTVGAFTWVLKDSGGVQKASGDLTYNSTSGRWTVSHTFSSGLSSGNYVVYYNITTANGRKASTTGYLAIESSFNLSGRVTNASTGAGLGSVEVVVAGRTTYTNTQGYYSFSSLDAAQAPSITATKAGYAVYIANINPPSAGTSIVHDFSMHSAVVGKPVITDVRAKYNGIFLAGISTNNDFTAIVEWNGTPGVVEFYANNTLKRSIPGSSTGATATFNMGSDFPGKLSQTANKVKIVARNNEGGVSELFEIPVVVIPQPAAIVLLSPWFSVQGTDNEVYFALDFDFPEPPIKQVIDLPVIGKFGTEIAANASFDYTVSNGDWEAAFGIGAEGKQGKRGRRPTIPGLTRYPKMKLYIGNKEISGKIGGGARGTATITNGITFDEVSANAEIGAKLELGRVGLLDVIPGLSTAVSYIPGLSDITKTISFIIYVEPELGGEIVFGLDPQFAFKSLEISGDIGLEAAYEPDLGICEMRLYVGGKPGVTFQVPGELIKELRFKAYAGAEFKAWLITLGPIEYVFINITIPEESGQAQTVRTLAMKVGDNSSLKPRPINRSYLADGSPRFVVYEKPMLKMLTTGAEDEQLSPLDAFRAMGKAGLPRTRLFSLGAEEPKILQADLPLIENVFPFSEPAIAGVGQELMLLYVSDNGAPGELQFTDINWLRFDGTNWTAPAAIATDTRAEFAPQVAFDGDGDAVAVWERVKDPDFDTVDISAMAAQMEIVWSRWDRAAGSWSTPEALTDNNYLDHKPLLAGPMADGSIMAVWTENQGNLQIGDSKWPSNVLWTKWDHITHTWNGTHTLESNVVCRLSESFSGSGSKAVYAWTQDVDGDINTPDDQELFVRQFNDPNWAAGSVRVTNDGTPDRNIRVAVSQEGDFYLVWQRAGDLVMEHNPGGMSVVRENSQTVAFSDYVMTFGPAGNLVLIWQEQSKEGVDAFCRVYDPASDKWSEDTQIFADSPLERSFAPIWDNVGNLTVAYNRVDIQLTNKTVELESGEIVEVNDVPTPGRVDLGIFKRVLVKDVAVMPGDFTADGSNCLPGDEVKLSAAIRNLGDVSIQDVNVTFYDGDPDSGGIEIGRQTIQGWLRGASSGQVEITWRVPEPEAQHDVYVVVDPNNQINEFNESNNKLVLKIGGTDLMPKVLSSKAEEDGSARIIVEVYNAGAPAAPETILAIVKGDEEGIPIATTIVPSLQAGRLAQVALELPKGTVLAGENIFTIIADQEGKVNDVFPDDNRLFFAISGPILGDLNDDENVDWIDLKIFVSQWLRTDCSDPNWCEGADFDHSGTVNLVDFASLAENWWYHTPITLIQDFDSDGDIDFDDLNRLTSYWLSPCVGPLWCEGCDLDKNGQVNLADFALLAQKWLEGI